MKLFFIIIISLYSFSCSFDDKSGIWDGAITSNKEKNIFKEFKKISTSSEDVYDKKISLKKDFIINISKPVSNLNWNDIFYKNNNNLDNFEYKNLNQIFFKSKKITKNIISDYKLYENKNIILSDIKGNIIVFSLDEKKVISKFNFYKKQFKKIKKTLNFIVEKNIIYIADNLGYLYAYNYIDKNIVWAKNYKIPFSSNLKILNNILAVSDHNNHLYVINKKNGELVKLIPTEESSIKNEFVNNLSVDDKNNLYFLNSFGSLYSINLNKLTINWFNNFNKSFNLSPSNLFIGNKIINTNKEIIVSSNNRTFLIDLNTGSLLKSFNFSSRIKPIIIDKIVFFITNNNFLVAINLETKNILYSLDINEIKNPKVKSLKSDTIKEVMILDGSIFIFLKNSQVLNFDINGKFIEIRNLPSKIKTFPISIDGSILFLNNKNRLVILN